MRYTYVYKCSIHKVGNKDHGLGNNLVRGAVVLIIWDFDEKKETTNPFQKSMGLRISAILRLKINK